MLDFFVSSFGYVFLRRDGFIIENLGDASSIKAVEAIQANPDVVATGEVHLLTDWPIPSAIYGS